MKKTIYTIGCTLAVAFLLLGTMVLNASRMPAQDDGTVGFSRGSSEAVWSDEFIDESKIDSQLSYNYTITDDIVSMQNTYPVWAAYPQWKRMRSLVITNNGAVQTDCIVPITVYYDADMQTDFDDLRFADSTAVPLLYHLLKKTNGVSADIYLKLQTLSPGDTTVYMFYNNPSASSGSTSVFTWTRPASDDTRISYVEGEGAWDQDVALGTTRFLTAWEEGIGFEYLPDQSHRLTPRHIHGRLYDTNGQNPSPPPGVPDLSISTEGATYHCENPSIAFSSLSNYYFVVWEENPIATRYAVGIKGAFVRQSDGFVYTPSTIDDPEYQPFQYYPCYDPSVAYDELNGHFLVVWEKSDTSWNYDVWGRLYNYNGGALGAAFVIASGATYQGQPWVTSDNNGNFLVVYEDGTSGESGPLSIKSILLNSNTGAPIGSVQTLALGTGYVDNIFPSITFHMISQKYLVVWNTGDISVSIYWGDIQGRFLNINGVPEGSVLTIQNNVDCKIASVIPYLDSLFFVSYDRDTTGGIYGRLVSSESVLVENEFYLCDPASVGADFNELAVYNKNIFATWEDERYSDTHIFGTIWRANQNFTGGSVTSVFGDEVTRILDARVTSTPIQFENFVSWKKFNAVYNELGGTIVFDIMNESGTRVLKAGISNGEDLSLIVESVIRVRATFQRVSPALSSTLDNWTITALVGGDLEPPFTVLSQTPEDPDGLNGWYVSPIHISLAAYDNDTEPQNITTYYRINNGDVRLYTGEFVIDQEQADNTLEYWSVDIAENEELPHKILEHLNLDTSAPTITLLQPADLIYPGENTINGTVTEYLSGSGIAQLKLRMNGELVLNATYGSEPFIWFEKNFTADISETYEIHAEAYDQAGNKGEDHVSTICSERGLYQPGYLYLFDNQKIPLQLFVLLGLAAVVDYSSMYVVLPSPVDNTSSVDFTATQLFLGNTKTVTDNDLSDGCSVELALPWGFYEIKAHMMDSEDSELGTVTLISKVLVVLLPS